MVVLKSTAIKAAGYDPKSRILSIKFTSGPRIYEYPEVPEYIFRNLIAAASAGEYYNEHIKDQYSAR